MLERVQSNGKHLLGLINDVLDLSKIEAGQLTLSLADYSLKDVVHGVFSAVEPLAAEQERSRFKVEVPPDLPPGRGDERRLTQVLLNLVGNAIKFTDAGRGRDQGDGGQRRRSRLRCATPARASPTADQAKIFEEFQQVDNSITKKKGGTGLGLADLPAHRRDARRHASGSSPSSARARRSHFTLPVKVEQQARSGMSKCILVVEDQEDNRQILRDLLASAGYEMIEAENGEEALAAVAEQRPDLILMDIQLPVMDGYEATRRIKADPALKGIPIIVVTSYALSGDEDKARAAGCDDYVTKPYSPRALLAKIREYLPSSGKSAASSCTIRRASSSSTTTRPIATS